MRTAACILVPVLCALMVPRPDSITMLNVGQGDAFLVESKQRTILIDTGNQDRMLLDQLGRCGVRHLDWVVVTHADDDHCGSLDALQKAVEVDAVLLAEGIAICDDEKCRALVEQAKATADNVEELKAGDRFSVGRFAGRVLWPERLEESGGNSDSLVIELGYDGDGDGAAEVSGLFTGDAEEEQLAAILSKGLVGDIDILKVGHHGSRKAMSREQLAILDPEIALIGVGENNLYGHPTAEILEMLDAASCTVFRSDLDGGVRMVLRGNSVIANRL